MRTAEDSAFDVGTPATTTTREYGRAVQEIERAVVWNRTRRWRIARRTGLSVLKPGRARRRGATTRRHVGGRRPVMRLVMLDDPEFDGPRC
jgi:hypothetical protein